MSQIEDPTSRHNSYARSTARGPGDKAPSTLSGLWAAMRFLLPVSRIEDGDAAAFGGAPSWFLVLGILTGLAWAGLFKATWRLFGEIGSIRVVPPLAVVLMECLITGPFLALGLARTIHLLTSARPRQAALEL